MSDFDRVRPRGPRAPVGRVGQPTRRAQDGRQTLFSEGDPDAGFGTVRIACSRCHQTTVVSPMQVARLAMPSLHLPILRRRHPSYMTCPACRHRSWVKLSLWSAPAR